MSNRLDDQQKKPMLGNSPLLHGKVNTDNAGGANPPPVNPGKTSKKGSKYAKTKRRI